MLPKRARTVRRELKAAFSALGARRDADVALEALRALEPALADADRPGWQSVIDELEADRGSAPAPDVEAAQIAGAAAALLAERAHERGGPPAADALRRTARRRAGGGAQAASRPWRIRPTPSRCTTCGSPPSGCATSSRPPSPRSALPAARGAQGGHASCRRSSVTSTTVTCFCRACERTAARCGPPTSPPRATGAPAPERCPLSRRPGRRHARLRARRDALRALAVARRAALAAELDDVARRSWTHERPRAAARLAGTPPRRSSRDPDLYLNRELSWLDFNERVLELAEDPTLPLLERVKFAAIYTTNLDEFFMVRVAGVHDQLDAGVCGPPGRRHDRGGDDGGDRRARARARRSPTHAVSRTQLRPALADARHPRRLVHRSARTRCCSAVDQALRRRDLPGAHAARRRPRPAVPLHLEPLTDRSPCASATPSRGTRRSRE